MNQEILVQISNWIAILEKAIAKPDSQFDFLTEILDI